MWRYVWMSERIKRQSLGEATHRHTLCGNAWASFGTPRVPASRERVKPVLDEAGGVGTNGVFTDLIADLPCAAADPWIRYEWFDVAWSGFRERGEIGADVWFRLRVRRIHHPTVSRNHSPSPSLSRLSGSPRSEGHPHSSSTSCASSRPRDVHLPGEMGYVSLVLPSFAGTLKEWLSSPCSP